MPRIFFCFYFGNAIVAAGNLGFAIFLVLQPEFSAGSVAFSFSAALFLSLLAIWFSTFSARWDP
jgi:hypothetical protein